MYTFFMHMGVCMYACTHARLYVCVCDDSEAFGSLILNTIQRKPCSSRVSKMRVYSYVCGCFHKCIICMYILSIYSNLCSYVYTQASGIHDSLTRALLMQEALEQRERCSWKVSNVQETRGWGLGEDERREQCSDVSGACEDTDAGTLYLSVIMVARHDSTQFCQVW
jgi:hypothetical protein